jgi:hypothetical protein
MIKIQGPVSANLWEVEGKKIWIFGDQHHMSEDCANKKHLYLEDMIKTAVLKTTEKIEVFVERGRSVDENEKDPETYMSRLNKHFFHCYNSNCSIKLHAADRRHDDKLLNDITSLTIQIRSIFFDHNKNSFPEMDEFLRNNIKFDTSLFTSGLKKLPREILTVRDYFLYLFENLKINKQLGKIENAVLAKQIDECFSIDQNSIIGGLKGPSYKKFLDIRMSDLIRDLSNLGKPTKLTKKKSSTNNVLTLFILGFSERSDIFMDKYLIGRVFGKSVGNKIVISVGYVHADTYNEFFKKIRAKHIFKSEAKRDKQTFNQCLSMKKNLF